MKIWKKLPIVLLLVPLIVKAQGQPTMPIYTYSVPSGGYAPNGNVTNYSDSVTGTWSIQYDGLNRLQGANAASGPYNSAVLGWQYDSFGNRLNQTVSGSPGATVPSDWATYDASNRMVTNQNAVSPGILSYDGSGNMTFDGTNQYLYDAESLVCAVLNTNTGQITQYLYDAEGHRVAKGHPATSSSTLYCPTGRADFTPDETYIVGQNSEQVSELDGNGAWKHTNVYAAGQLIATYDQEGSQQLLHFNVTDPLGTKRIQTTASGAVELTCLSLPFGDGLTCNGTGQDATEHHFTGKERDTESGLDYFGARYYASNMGRWMSPDWADKPEAVPYSDLTNPQSLNLYGYVNNNPLSKADKDGHDPNDVYKLLGGAELVAPEATPFILGAAAAVAIYQNRDAISQGAQSLATSVTSLFSKSDSSTPAPAAPVGATAAPATPLPSGLVGTQDDKSGPTGGRHLSGPLDPAHGGTGDAGKDFGTLTGGKSGPAPQGKGYPPGTQVGDNDIAHRPARGNSGPRIDIPANGDKPHETLHYPKDPQ